MKARSNTQGNRKSTGGILGRASRAALSAILAITLGIPVSSIQAFADVGEDASATAGQSGGSAAASAAKQLTIAGEAGESAADNVEGEGGGGGWDGLAGATGTIAQIGDLIDPSTDGYIALGTGRISQAASSPGQILGANLLGGASMAMSIGALGDRAILPTAADGASVDRVTVTWVTGDTPGTDDNDPALLTLAPAAGTPQAMQFQVDIALSGEHPYEPGAFELTIPRQIWVSRTGSHIGTMTLSVPPEPSTADFQYRQMGDSYVITNNHELRAATKMMFQFTVRSILPQDVVSGEPCDSLAPSVTLVTHKGTSIGRAASPISAVIDAHAKISGAWANAGSIITDSESVPEALRVALPAGADPSAYAFVRYYTYAAGTGATHFTLSVQPSITDNLGGTLLGVVDAAGTAHPATALETSYEIFSGYGTERDRKGAYVWVAYPLDTFDESQQVYDMGASFTWTCTELDDATATSQKTATARTAFHTPHHYVVEKIWNGEPAGEEGKQHRPDSLTVKAYHDDEKEAYATIVLTPGDDGVYRGEWIDTDQAGRATKLVEDASAYYYPSEAVLSDDGRTFKLTNNYLAGGPPPDESGVSKKNSSTGAAASDMALNRLRGGSDITVSFDLATNQRVMRLTGGYSSDTDDGLSTDPRDYCQHPYTLELVDEPLSLTGVDQLTAEDYRVHSVVMGTPDMYVSEGEPGRVWQYTRSGGGAPDVQLFGRASLDDDWVLMATFPYSTGSSAYVAEGTGASIQGNTVILPEGILQVKASATTKAAGIDLSYRVNVLLHASASVKDVATRLLETMDEPVASFNNKARGVVLTGGSAVFSAKEQVASAELRGRDVKAAATATTSISMPGGEADNDVENHRVRVHFTAEAVEQSNMTTAAAYADAKDQGIVPVDGMSTWYDLLPYGMVPDVSTVALTNADDIISSVEAIPNFRGSGRTLLVVKANLAQHESYQRRDPRTGLTGYRNTQRISFDAWYPWESFIESGGQVENVAVFETGASALGNVQTFMGEPDNPLYGNNRQSQAAVAGETHAPGGGTQSVASVLTDLDPDTSDPRFVYARAATTLPHLDLRLTTSLDKRVTVDGSGLWSSGNKSDTLLYEGQPYTYMLRVGFGNDASVKLTKNLIILDKLDAYVPTYENGDDHGKPSWKGRLVGVDVSELVAEGEAPVVYYSIDSDVDVSQGLFQTAEGQTGPQLRAGWIKADDYDGALSAVTAIAVDASKKADGTDFEFDAEESVTVYVHMAAPIGETFQQALIADNGATAHAFNEVWMTCDHQLSESQDGTWEHAAPQSYSYTRVGLKPFNLNVEKQWLDDDDRDGLHADIESIDVHLLRDGVDTDLVRSLGVSNGWKNTFENIPYGDGAGHVYTYSFSEDRLPAQYNPVVRVISETERAIVNMHDPARITVSGTKTWEGDEGRELLVRPGSLKLTLQKRIAETGGAWSDVAAQTITGEGSEWTFAFPRQYKFEHGKLLEYRVIEAIPQDYVAAYANPVVDPDTGDMVCDITNTYHPFGDITVKKTVIDGTEAANQVPFAFTIQFQDAEGVSLEDKYACTMPDGTEATIADGGTFELKHGEEFVVHEVPAGVHYIVSEQTRPAFTAESDELSGDVVPNDPNGTAFKNTYQAQASVSFAATKKLAPSNVEMKRAQFRFGVYSAQGAELGVAGNAAPADESANEADITFGAIAYNEHSIGTHEYIIREIDRGKPGFTYDGRTYKARVTVTDSDGSGVLGTEVAYFHEDGTPLGTGELPLFENTYTATGSLELKAAKVLEGRELQDGEFSFALNEEDGTTPAIADPQDSSKPKVFHNGADGIIAFDAIEFTAADIGLPKKYVARELKPSELGGTDDETIKYEGVDHPITFTVTAVDNGDGTLSFDQTVTDENGMDADPEFKNSLADGTLVITKRVADADSVDPNQPFTFHVQLNGLKDNSAVFSYQVERADGGSGSGGNGGLGGQGTEPEGSAAPSFAAAGGSDTTAFGDAVAGAIGFAGAQAAHADSDMTLEAPAAPAAPVAVAPGATTGALRMQGAGAQSLGAQDDAIASGVSGTCVWEIDAEGNLVVRPQNGTVGTLEDWNLASAPWWSYNKQVKTVRFEGTVKALTTRAMFYDMTNATSIDLAGLDTSAVSNFSKMFYRCYNVEPTDVTCLDVRNATNMEEMFYDSSILQNPDLTSWETPRLSNARYMFSGCRLTSLSWPNWSAPSLTDAKSMFSGCSSLQNIDLSGWNVPALATADSMFYRSSVQTVDLSYAVLPNLTSFYRGFFECKSLTSLNLTSFSAPRLTDFAECFKSVALESFSMPDAVIGENSNWNNAFNGCSKLQSVDFSGLRAGSASNMNMCFWYCTKLKYLDMSRFGYSGGVNMSRMHYACTELRYVSVAGWNMSTVSLGETPTPFTGAINRGGMITKIVELDLTGATGTSNRIKVDPESALWERVDNPSITLTGKELSYYRGDFAHCWRRASTYAVAFDPNDDPAFVSGTMAVQNVKLGENVSKFKLNKCAFENDNDFLGWNTKPDGSGDFYPDEAEIDTNNLDKSFLTLYAQWDHPGRYTATFDGAGGIGTVAPRTVATDRAFKLPGAVYYLAGHAISCWRDSHGKEYKLNAWVPADTYQPGENVTFTAIWEKRPSMAGVSDGGFDIELRAGERAVISGLPAGASYVVSETNPNGWTLSESNGTEGVIAPAASSYAAVTNEYTPDRTSAQISVFKYLDRQLVGADSGFMFSLYEGDTLVQSNVGTSSDGKVYFAPIEYTEPGKHSYTVREKAGDTPGMKYDTHSAKVEVNVFRDEQGRLGNTVTYASGYYDNPRFYNESNGYSGTLYIEKKVEGATQASRNDTFTFRIDVVGESEPRFVSANIKTGYSYDYASAYVYDLPIDATLTVTEINLPYGWECITDQSVTTSVKPQYGYYLTYEAYASFTNKYTLKDATAIVQARKAVAGRMWEDGETASFVLEPADGPGSAPMPEGTTSLTATASSEQPLASFDEIPFTTDHLRGSDGAILDHKDYLYTVCEALPTDGEGNLITKNSDGTDAEIEYDENDPTRVVRYVLDGTSYDCAARTVAVRLSLNSEGELQTTVLYNNEATEPVFTNSYEPNPAPLSVSGWKLVEGERLAKGAFEVDLYDDNEDVDAQGASTGIAGINHATDEPYKRGELVASGTASATDGGAWSIAVPLSHVNFTQPGEYHYVLRERIPANATDESGRTYGGAVAAGDSAEQLAARTWRRGGVSYDTKSIPVTVTVSDTDTEGRHVSTLHASASYAFEGQDGYATAGFEGAVFDNGYHPVDATARIQAEKLIAGQGRAWMDSDFFAFELTGEGGAPIRVEEDGQLVAHEVLTDIARKGAAAVGFEDLVFTYSDLYDEDSGTYVRSKTFIYRVHEAAYDDAYTDVNPAAGGGTLHGFTYAADQTVAVNVTDDGSGALKVTYGGMRDEEGALSGDSPQPPTLKFTNAYTFSGARTLSIPVAKRVADVRGTLLPGWKINEEGNVHDWTLSADGATEAVYTFELRSTRDEAPMPEGAVQRTDNDGKGKVARTTVTFSMGGDPNATTVSALFGDIKFTEQHVGEWDYAIAEVLPEGATEAHPVDNEAQLAYDTSLRGVHVVVSDNGDGTLAPLTVRYMGEKADGVPVFTNKEAGDTDIVLMTKKELAGEQLHAGEFDFELFEAEVSDDLKTWAPKGEAIAEATNRVDGMVAGAPREFTVADVDHPADSNIHEKTFYYMGREVVPEDAENADGVKYSEATDAQKAAGGFVKEGVTYANDWSLHAVTVREKIVVVGSSSNFVYIQKVVCGTMGADGTVTMDDGGVWERTGEPATAADAAVPADAYAAFKWPVHKNEYHAEATVKVPVEKRMTGRDLVDGDDFVFELAALDGAPLRLEDGTQPSKLEVHATKASPSVSFDGLVFTQDDLLDSEGKRVMERMFSYRVREVAPDDAENAAGVKYGDAADAQKAAGGFAKNGVTYAADQTVAIKVTDDGMGTLKVENADTGAAELAALQFVNAYAPTGAASATIDVAKVIEDRAWQRGDAFSFQLAAISNTAGVTTPMPVGGASATISFGDSASTAAEGALAGAFGPIEFSKAGTYTYTVSEMAPSAGSALAGIEYDTTAHKVEVLVTDDGMGGFSAAVSYDDNEDAKAAVFVNEYEPAPATLAFAGQKALEGRAMKAGEFSFRIAATDERFRELAPVDQPAGFPQNTTAAATGTFAPRTATFSEPGTYYFSIKENVPFEAIDNRANGVTYDTHEAHVTVTVTVTDPATGLADGKLHAVATYDNSASDVSADAAQAARAAFTNVFSESTAIDLSVTKVLEGRDWRSDDAFEFVLRPVGAAPLRVEHDGAVKELSELSAFAKDGTNERMAVFEDIAFNQDDIGQTYQYRIDERNAGRTVAGVAYPRKTILAYVSVYDDGAGNLSASVKYGDADSADDATSEPQTVANTYAAGTADLSALVAKRLSGKGRIWGEVDTYTFMLEAEGNTAEGGNGETVATPMPAGADGLTETVVIDMNSQMVGTEQNFREASFGNITFALPGEYRYRLWEEKHVNDQGEVIDPWRGTKYDDAIHEITVVVTDNGDGALTTEIRDNGEVLDGPVVFENVYTPATVSLPIAASKTVDGKVQAETAAADKEFSFVIARVVPGKDGAPDLHIPLRTAKADPATGLIDFGALECTQEMLDTPDPEDGHYFGEFLIAISESVPEGAVDVDGDGRLDADGIGYDGHIAYAKVRVDDPIDGLAKLFVTKIEVGRMIDGSFKAVVSYGDGAEALDSAKVNLRGSEAAASLLTFDNHVLPSDRFDVTAVAEIIGRDWADSDAFLLELVPAAGSESAPMPTGAADGKVARTATSAERTVSFGTLVFGPADIGKEYRYTVTETPAANAVWHEQRKLYVDNGLAYPAKLVRTLAVKVSGRSEGGKTQGLTTQAEEASVASGLQVTAEWEDEEANVFTHVYEKPSGPDDPAKPTDSSEPPGATAANKPATSSGSSPKTGDALPAWPLALIAAGSAVAIAVAAVRRRREN